MSRVTDIAANARSAGLLRDFNKTALAPLVEAVFIPFSKTGVPVLGTDLYFASNSKLDYQNATIVGLQVVDTTTTGNFPDGQFPTDGLAPTQLNAFLFVAQNSAREHIFSVPLHCLDSRLNRGKICNVQLETQVWGNCYIQCVDTAGLSSTNGVWINVYYFSKRK